MGHPRTALSGSATFAHLFVHAYDDLHDARGSKTRWIKDDGETLMDDHASGCFHFFDTLVQTISILVQSGFLGPPLREDRVLQKVDKGMMELQELDREQQNLANQTYQKFCIGNSIDGAGESVMQKQISMLRSFEFRIFTTPMCSERERLFAEFKQKCEVCQNENVEMMHECLEVYKVLERRYKSCKIEDEYG